MPITGLIGNSNLIDETGPGEIESGYEFAESFAAESGLPLAFITSRVPVESQLTDTSPK